MPRAVVLVCRKCSKKLRGGFGEAGDERLAKALRRQAVAASGRRAGKPRRAETAIIEVGCLDVCPKQAVVVLRGDRPGDWLIVPAGASLDAVGAELGLVAAFDQ